MALIAENIHHIKNLYFEETGILLSSIDIEAMKIIDNDNFLWIKTDDKKSPDVIQIIGINNKEKDRILHSSPGQ